MSECVLAELWTLLGALFGVCADAGGVMYLQPSEPFVLWRAVSAIAVVRTAQGMVVVADRAALPDEPSLFDDVPARGDDAAKLFVTDGGVVVALAGRIVVGVPGDGLLDLRNEVRRVVGSEADPDIVAGMVRGLFDAVAATVRAHVGLGDFPAPPLTAAVLTVAIVVGVSASGPLATTVGLTTSGQCEARTMGGDGHVYAPTPQLPDLELAVIRAAAAPTCADALDIVATAMNAAAVTSKGRISLDLDHASVIAGRAVRPATRVFQPTPLPPGF